jgi:hypothetical protein
MYKIYKIVLMRADLVTPFNKAFDWADESRMSAELEKKYRYGEKNKVAEEKTFSSKEEMFIFLIGEKKANVFLGKGIADEFYAFKRKQERPSKTAVSGSGDWYKYNWRD